MNASDTYPVKGHVDFVGAGPGDPDLLTLKALRAFEAADIVMHDRLISAEVLELAGRSATLVDVGKAGFGPSWKQEDIDALLVEHALTGARVVRLKSGDPTVFGRLDEEIEAVAGRRYLLADRAWYHCCIRCGGGHRSKPDPPGAQFFGSLPDRSRHERVCRS